MRIAERGKRLNKIKHEEIKTEGKMERKLVTMLCKQQKICRIRQSGIVIRYNELIMYGLKYISKF
jgi:hypothetical protein